MRVGIIGYGRWAPNLARNIAKHATVAWVCDPSVAAQRRAMDAGYIACGAPGKFYDDCDAVVIASPINHHPLQVDVALRKGKHVLCEKPMAPLASCVRSANREASSRSLTLMMSAPWNYHPAIIRAGEVARDLGAPLWFRAARTSWDERPLDPIADLLPHDVGILKTWTGQRVAGVSAVVAGPTASVTLLTEGGVLGTVQYSYRERGKSRRVELGCEHDALSFDGIDLTVEGAARGSWVEPCSGPEPLDAMCAEFAACCREGRAPRYGNVDDALRVAEVIEAAHKSVSERRVVTL